MTVYWKGLGPLTDFVRLLHKRSWGRQSRLEVLDVSIAMIVRPGNRGLGVQPISRDRLDNPPDGVGRQSWRKSSICVRDRAGIRQQDVVAHLDERTARMCGWVAPGVMEVERGAVVDQPQPPAPYEQVWVAGCAIHVRDQGIEPDDVGSKLWRRNRSDRRCERQ